MEALKVVLIVLFVIISVLLVLLVLIQNGEDGGMGGLLSGSGTAAFGSRSASVINKTTFVFVALFFLTAFGIARLNKAPAIKELTTEESVENQLDTDTEAGEWWNEDVEPEAKIPENTLSASDAQ